MATADANKEQVCYIRSTIEGDGKPACLLEWGPVQALLPPPLVLATARDLMTAAVAAETDIALVQTFREEFKADDQMLAVVLSQVRGRRPAPSGKVALRIAAVAGASTGQPYVRIARGSMAGQLSPDEARQMAVNWVEAATAAAIDIRLRYALGEWDRLNVVEIEELFTIMQGVQR